MSSRARSIISKWIQQIKLDYGCQYCGMKILCCLTFHHLDKNDKNHNVCKSKTKFSKKVLREELNKTIVLCYNCHAQVEEGLIVVDPKRRCRIGENYKIISCKKDD